MLDEYVARLESERGDCTVANQNNMLSIGGQKKKAKKHQFEQSQ